MHTTVYKTLLILLALGFALAFSVTVIPPLLAKPDLIGAALAGFVNPYAAGYATDAIMSWCVLAVWVWYEARTQGMRHGWIALLLGVAPGVATGLAVYLLMRLRASRQTDMG